MCKEEYRTNEYGEVYKGDWCIRYSVVETGHRKPFFEVKKYESQQDYEKEIAIMVSQFTNETDAQKECRRLNKDVQKHPNLYKTIKERSVI